MLRTNLYDALKVVSSGLASRDLLPIFSCFCFKGGRVFAYNDVVAVDAPCDIGFEGAVKGSILLGTLAASRAKTVDIEKTDAAELVFKLGRAKAKLPIIPSEQFAFEWPDTKKGKAITDDFLIGLEAASFAMGTDASYPSRLGITVAGQYMYASDNFVVTRVLLEEEWPTIVLPPRFVDLLLSNRSRGPEKLFVTKDYIIATFSDGVRIFSKTVHEGSPAEFEGLFGELPEVRTFPIPKGFDTALDKALVVLHDDDPHTRFQIVAGKMRMRSSSPEGVVNESAKVSKEHPDVDAKTAPAFVRKALKYASHFAILPTHDVFYLCDEAETTTILIALVMEEEIPEEE